MQISPIHLIFIISAAMLAGCSDDIQEPPVGDAAAGRVIAERSCRSCHAIGPDDESTIPVAPPFREIVRRWPPENLAEALGEGIQVAHPGSVQMPEFELEPQEIDDLIAYLQTLQPE